MTNWYWIRHGPTHLKSLVGWSDVDVDLSNINRLKKSDFIYMSSGDISNLLVCFFCVKFGKYFRC